MAHQYLVNGSYYLKYCIWIQLYHLTKPEYFLPWDVNTETLRVVLICAGGLTSLCFPVPLL